MSQYQHTNPTKGTKVSSDPNTQSDPKREYSGIVLKDSLAAESIRSGGSFSKGNPTGISGTSAANTTTNRGDDTEGFRMVHASEHEDTSGHFSKHRTHDVGEQYETPGSRRRRSSGGSSHSGGRRDSHPSIHGYFKRPEGKHGTHAHEKHEKHGGDVATKKDHGERDHGQIVDKQPEIGSEEDPGRIAEWKFQQRNARIEGVETGAFSGDSGDNPFSPLSGEKQL